MTTTIEWTDETWNPVVGCEKCSPGCDGCYAIGVTHRGLHPAHRGLTFRDEIGTDWTGEVRCLPERLATPLTWKRPRRVFVNSLSDLFHSDVPLEFILKVWTAMSRCPQHTFQILTKRPQRLARIVPAIAWEWESDELGGMAYPWPGEWVAESDLDGGGEEPLPNVWLGTSIESDRYAFRANHLRATPAAVRFLSLEPLLGPLPSLDLTGIDWVIVGGESGPGARPMHPDWARDIRDRCVAAGVPFFLKQWGALVTEDQSPEDITLPGEGWYLLGDDGPVFYRVGKKAAGRELDGRTWDEFPEVRA